MSYLITNRIGNRNNNSNFDSDDKNNNDYNENFTNVHLETLKDKSESSISREEERTLTPIMDNSNEASHPNSSSLQGNMIFSIISLLRSDFRTY